MKKSIFIFLIMFALIFSFSCVLATNDMNGAKDAVRNTVGGAENVVEDAAKGTADAIKNGTGDLENGASNVTNTDGNKTDNDKVSTNMNNGTYDVTRTATTDGTATSNVWTWIIVAIIAIVIIALIWYYSTRSKDNY